MSTKDHKERVHRFAEAYNKGRAAAMTAIDESFATNLVFHSGTGDDLHGVKEFKELIGRLLDAFPDGRMTIGDVFFEGDKAAIRFTMTGTNKGAYTGVPPTNKKVTVPTIHINRYAGDKVVEVWQAYDTFGMMQQLGVVPTPRKGK